MIDHTFWSFRQDIMQMLGKLCSRYGKPDLMLLTWCKHYMAPLSTSCGPAVWTLLSLPRFLSGWLWVVREPLCWSNPPWFCCGQLDSLGVDKDIALISQREIQICGFKWFNAESMTQNGTLLAWWPTDGTWWSFLTSSMPIFSIQLTDNDHLFPGTTLICDWPNCKLLVAVRSSDCIEV